MPLLHCKKCHHEWETIKKKERCSWCGGKSYVLTKYTSMQIMLKTQLASSTSSKSERFTKANCDRIDRENFIRDHAKKYWTEYPITNQKNMFNDYKKDCPRNLVYSFTTWKKIVKEHHLDPRTDIEKKKFSGRPVKNNLEI